LFSMLCMLCMDKGCSLNLDLMLSSNYVVIMTMLMFIYVYMHVCMYVVSDRVVINHDFFMLIFMYMYLSNYVSMPLSNRVVKDHSCGGIIAYASEWHEEVPNLMRNQVGRVA